jgi:CRP-like cAMP-binding protein
MFAVVEGKVRIGRTSGDGREMIITIVEPPSWIGEVGLFDGLERSYDYTAETDSVLVEVPSPSLLSFLEREPQYWRDLGRLLAGKLRLAFLGLESAATATVRERVAHRLVMITDGYGEWADRTYPFVKVSQETLATMVSSTRQSVNTALRSLHGAGVIRIVYGGVEVVDREGLRQAGGLLPTFDPRQGGPLRQETAASRSSRALARSTRS